MIIHKKPNTRIGMSKHFSVMLTATAFVLLLLSQLAFSDEIQGEKQRLTDIQRILKSGVLRVAVCDMQNPPSFYRKPNGAFDGIDIRMAKDIAEQLGVKAEFIATKDGFDAIPDLVAEGKADIGVGTLSITAKRAKKVLFTHPYVANLHNALILNGRSAARLGIDGSLEKVKKAKLKVGIKKLSSRKEILDREYPGATVFEFDNVSDMNTAVIAGTVDALMLDSFFAEYIMRQPGCTLVLQKLVIPGSEDNYGIAVNPECVMLRDYLDILIKERSQLMRGSQYMRNLLMGIEGGDTVWEIIGNDGDSPDGNTTIMSSVCIVAVFILLVFILFFIYFLSPNGWILRRASVMSRKNQTPNN